jgi:hypothetical protein
MSISTIDTLEIALLCNKQDVYLTNICVASIRYYYPDVVIFLIKDELNGTFSTDVLEEKFSVNLLDLGLKKFGWCTGKISLILAEQLKGRKFLLLDSDIVFIGKVLDKLVPELVNTDFIVSPEWGTEPDNDWFRRTYYDIKWAQQLYPDYRFPDYTFNCGQMIVTPGRFKPEEFKGFVELKEFPYWTKVADTHLPCRDQSLLNILLPLKNNREEISLKQIIFMLWSEEGDKINSLQLQHIKQEGYPFLIHWAGAVRVPFLKKMTRSDILLFFQQEYYKRLPFGELRRTINNIYAAFAFYIHKTVRSITKK